MVCLILVLVGLRERIKKVNEVKMKLVSENVLSLYLEIHHLKQRQSNHKIDNEISKNSFV